MDTNKKTVLFVIVFAFVIAFINSIPKSIGDSNQPITEPTNNNLVETKVQTPVDPTVIPGLMPADIYTNLEEKGFTLTKVLDPCCSFYAVMGSVPVRYTVEIHGDNGLNVKRVNASVVTTVNKNTKAIAKPFFAWVATIPYSGANPEVASKWVEDNVGKRKKDTIAGQTFELDRGQSNGLHLMIYP